MRRGRGGGARGAAEPRVLAGSKSLCDPWPSPRVKGLCGDEGPLRGGWLSRIGVLQEMWSSPRQTAPWFADHVDGNREAVDCNHDAKFGSGGNCVFGGSYSSSGGGGRGDGACGGSDTVDNVIHQCSVDDGVAPCGPPPGNRHRPGVWQRSAGSSPASTVEAPHYTVLSSMSTDVSNAMLDK